MNISVTVLTSLGGSSRKFASEFLVRMNFVIEEMVDLIDLIDLIALTVARQLDFFVC